MEGQVKQDFGSWLKVVFQSFLIVGLISFLFLNWMKSELEKFTLQSAQMLDQKVSSFIDEQNKVISQFEEISSEGSMLPLVIARLESIIKEIRKTVKMDDNGSVPSNLYKEDNEKVFYKLVWELIDNIREIYYPVELDASGKGGHLRLFSEQTIPKIREKIKEVASFEKKSLHKHIGYPYFQLIELEKQIDWIERYLEMRVRLRKENGHEPHTQRNHD